MQCLFCLVWRFSISCAPGVRQSEMRYILRQCMLTLSKYWEHIYYIYLLTVYHCFTSLNLLAKKILKANYNLCTGMHHITHCNSSGLVLQVVFLERYVLDSNQFLFRPFQFSVSVFHFSFPFPLFPNALKTQMLSLLVNQYYFDSRHLSTSQYHVENTT